MGPFLEHLLIFASAFLFPPVALIVVLCVLLATFGKSLGLRQIYVDTLITIFEWGARQIKTSEKLEKLKRNKESVLNLGAEAILSSDDELSSDDLEVKSDGYESGSGLRRRHGSGTSIIRRETQMHLEDEDDDDIPDNVYVNSRGWAVIRDSVDFVKAGIEAIIEDEVTSRFEAEQLVSWNMLTRTSIRFYQFVNWKLTTLYFLGFLFRYCCMLPLRISIFVIGLMFLIVSTAVVGLVPEGELKRKLNFKCMLICYRILSRSVSAVVTIHDEHNRSNGSGIAVANHTSPIDAMILSTDNVYALIGQRHPGLLGLIQRALSRASSHIWFERSEARDRAKVAQTLRDHVNDPTKLPILIFPEGTCINNTSVMMFKKGSFEVGATVYPIAMKYDSRFGDAFWNSSEQTWAEYLLRMMTSWAIICNVWYLPPMHMMPGEEAIDFANRVKKAIALKGGLVDLEWDGQLKRSKVPPKLVQKQQEKYCNRFSRYTSTCEPPKLELLVDNDYLMMKSPGVSGYNSLEELPEDAVVSSEEDTENEKEVETFEMRKRTISARKAGLSDSNPLSPSRIPAVAAVNSQ